MCRLFIISLHPHQHPKLWKSAAGFLTAHGEERIRTETLERYRSPASSAVFVWAVAGKQSVALSATLLNDEEALSSVTVTRPAMRRQGHATACVRAKAKALHKQGVVPAATVATDNPASLGLMKAAGWRSVTSITLRRSSGSYQAKLFISMLDKPSCP